MLATFTKTLTDLGFRSAGILAEGLQHLWVRGEASIDVLQPDGIGERASRRSGVTGSPTLPTAGGTQALQRSETVRVSVAGREGSVRRPNLVGALVVRRQRSATRATLASVGTGATLARLLTARDFRSEVLTKKDRQRLRAMVAAPRRTARCCSRCPMRRTPSIVSLRRGSCSHAGGLRCRVAAKIDARQRGKLARSVDQ
jgi:hypothetical protein